MTRPYDSEELAEHWTLQPTDADLLANKSGPTRLGFAVLLLWFRREGCFPPRQADVPAPIVAYVARQVGVPAVHFLDYDWRGRAIKYHRAQIRAALGVREVSVEDARAIVAWLTQEVLPLEHALDRLKAAFYARCRAERLEPPTAERVDRLVRSALASAEARLHAAVTERLPLAIRERLEALLAPTEDGTTQRARLHELKADPGPAGLDSLLAETAKLRYLRDLGLSDDVLHDMPPRLRQSYRQRVAAEEPFELRRHPTPLRLTLLVTWALLRQHEIVDSLADLLIDIVARLDTTAERRVERELLRDFKRVAGKQGLLFRIAEASLERPDEPVRLVKEFKASGPAYRLQVQTVMRGSYQAHYRRMLPPLLAALDFQSGNDAHRPIIEAVALLKQYAGTKLRVYPEDETVPLEGRGARCLA
jgi:hypothetical protein